MKQCVQTLPKRDAGEIETAQRAQESRRYWAWGIAYLHFFLLYYVVAALWTEPRVHYFGRPAAFYFDERFFRSFLIRPGGLLEYIASGLHQCDQFTWLGAGVTTALAGLLSLGSWTLLRRLEPGPAATLCLWPAVGLLAVQRQYAFPWLETWLGLIGLLWLAAAYVWVPAKRPWLRWLIFLGISWPGYVLLAGAYLVFALYCGLVEVLAWRRYWLALALWGLAAVVPAVGASYFAVHLSDAYLLLLPFGLGQFPTVATVLPYAALPLAALAKATRPFLGSAWQQRGHVLPRAGTRARAVDKNVPTPARARVPFGWRRLLEPALLAALAIAAVGGGWNAIPQGLARIRCFSHDQDWDGVLKQAPLLPVYDPSTIAHVNRALSETGRLPYEMFAYPQKAGYEFWFSPHRSLDYRQWMVASDLLFEMGQVNRAERMAGEALELNGYLPDVLKRLADVDVLKGEPQAARLFLNILAKTPFQRGWARARLQALEADPQLTHDPELQRVRAFKLTSDYPFGTSTEEILLQCLHQNRTNRVAFEYLLAYYLLARDLDNFVHYLRGARTFNYPEIPAHYEEALVLAQDLKGGTLAIPDIAHGQQPRLETLRRLERFNEQVRLRGTDLERAKTDLAAEFGSTYWYYYTFGASGAAVTRTDLFPKQL